jgi:uncharacterized membrane protein
MLAIPFIALLFGEAFLVCGFLPLCLIVLALQLYGKPNLTKERCHFIRLLIGWLAPMGRKLGFGLMGIMFGLHMKHNDQSQYYLGLMVSAIGPVLNTIVYVMWTKIFGRKVLPCWIRCNRGSSMIAYMLALSTFEFRLMHLVLLASCIGYTITDKIYFLIF